VLDVRFGLKADICAAISDVRFTPNSDRESGPPQKVMSALPPKADMCGATSDVCFGPIADIQLFVATFKKSSFAFFLFHMSTQHDFKLRHVSNGRHDQDCCYTNQKWTSCGLNKYS